MKVKLDTEYKCANGDKVSIMTTQTNDVGRQMYFGIRVIEDSAVSVETYTDEGVHYWNCDLDIIEEIKPFVEIKEQPWHMP